MKQPEGSYISVLSKIITAAERGMKCVIDVRDFPLDNKALMRLMDLYDRTRDGERGRHPNITVMGLKEKCQELHETLSSKELQAETKQAYQDADTARKLMLPPGVTPAQKCEADIQKLNQYANPSPEAPRVTSRWQ